MLLRNLRRPADEPAAAGGVDQLPRLHRPAGCGRSTRRCARAPAGWPRGWPGSRPSARRSPPARRGRARNRARTTTPPGGSASGGSAKPAPGAPRRTISPERVTISAQSRHAGHIAAIGAGVHRHRAADGAGNAATGTPARPARPPRRARPPSHRAPRPPATMPSVLHRDRRRSRAPASPPRPACRHRARSGWTRRRSTITGTCQRQRAQEGGQVLGVGRPHQHLRRPADAEPGVSAPAPRRPAPARATAASWSTRCEIAAAAIMAPPRARLVGLQRGELAGSALAHCVMLPAPRQTTKSPGRAMACTISARCSGPGSGTTLRWPRARRPSTSASRSMPAIGASPAA